ncbi:MAG: fasciclin domain-containing protein [Bacteroidota bacterium]
MRNLLNKLTKRNLIFQIAVVSALTLTFSSCEKEAIAPGSDDAALKKGRAMSAAAPAPSDQSIAAIAIEAGFSELVEALGYVDAELDAGLVDLFLDGTDQYTVFAPTNDAFEALYEAQGIEDISDLPADLVLDILFYHVTEGRRASNSVVPPRGVRTIETLLGETFNVKPDLSIEAIGNTANIKAADISASNGIIHIIDAVILPIE